MALTFTLNLFSKVNCIVAKEHVCACLCLCISMHVWEQWSWPSGKRFTDVSISMGSIFFGYGNVLIGKIFLGIKSLREITPKLRKKTCK